MFVIRHMSQVNKFKSFLREYCNLIGEKNIVDFETRLKKSLNLSSDYNMFFYIIPIHYRMGN